MNAVKCVCGGDTRAVESSSTTPVAEPVFVCVDCGAAMVAGYELTLGYDVAIADMGSELTSALRDERLRRTS